IRLATSEDPEFVPVLPLNQVFPLRSSFWSLAASIGYSHDTLQRIRKQAPSFTFACQSGKERRVFGRVFRSKAWQRQTVFPRLAKRPPRLPASQKQTKKSL